MEDDLEAYQYNSYWETKRFLDNEELNQSWGINEACVGFSSLTSPEAVDGAESSGAAVNKTVVNERNRRKKMNDSICRLRSIVPRISKMDKASTIRDAIDYVQELQEQERQLEGEIAEIRSERASEISSNYEYNNCLNYPSLSPQTWNLPPIELLELNVQEIGDGNYIISMTCNKKNGAMSSMCEVIEYIDLKIMTSNITTVSGNIMFTLTVKAEELTSSELRQKIESGISMINGLRRH